MVNDGFISSLGGGAMLTRLVPDSSEKVEIRQILIDGNDMMIRWKLIRHIMPSRSGVMMVMHPSITHIIITMLTHDIIGTSHVTITDI